MADFRQTRSAVIIVRDRLRRINELTKALLAALAVFSSDWKPIWELLWWWWCVHWRKGRGEGLRFLISRVMNGVIFFAERQRALAGVGRKVVESLVES